MRPNVKVLLLGLSALAIFIVYWFIDYHVESEDFELKKADFAALYSVESQDSTAALSPSVALANTTDGAPFKHEPDSNQNILFIGDSMLEGLCKRFIDYADQNNHDLHTVIWYSSSTELWANTDTLQYFLNKFDPSYVVICLGGNELFVKDIPKRTEYIKKIAKKLEKVPFVWVGPPNWKKDTGINNAILSVMGPKRFFDSSELKLARGADHRHPTYPAAAIWMDTIARWIKSEGCEYPIKMDWPEKDVPSRNVTMLSPLKN